MALGASPRTSCVQIVNPDDLCELATRVHRLYESIKKAAEWLPFLLNGAASFTLVN